MLLNSINTDTTPFGGAQEVLKDLREGVFKGQEVHQFTLGAEGKVSPMTWLAI